VFRVRVHSSSTPVQKIKYITITCQSIKEKPGNGLQIIKNLSTVNLQKVSLKGNIVNMGEQKSDPFEKFKIKYLSI
jgi:hypothetical protein